MDFKKGKLILAGDLNFCINIRVDSTSHALGTMNQQLRTVKKLYQCQLVDVWRVQHPWVKGYSFYSGAWDMFKAGLYNGGAQTAGIGGKIIHRNNVIIKPCPSNNEAEITSNPKQDKYLQAKRRTDTRYRGRRPNKKINRTRLMKPHWCQRPPYGRSIKLCQGRIDLNRHQ